MCELINRRPLFAGAASEGCQKATKSTCCRQGSCGSDSQNCRHLGLSYGGAVEDDAFLLDIGNGSKKTNRPGVIPLPVARQKPDGCLKEAQLVDSWPNVRLRQRWVSRLSANRKIQVVTISQVKWKEALPTASDNAIEAEWSCACSGQLGPAKKAMAGDLQNGDIWSNGSHQCGWHTATQVRRLRMVLRCGLLSVRITGVVRTLAIDDLWGILITCLTRRTWFTILVLLPSLSLPLTSWQASKKTQATRRSTGALTTSNPPNRCASFVKYSRQLDLSRERCNTYVWSNIVVQEVFQCFLPAPSKLCVLRVRKLSPWNCRTRQGFAPRPRDLSCVLAHGRWKDMADLG